jgi:hypothetical protein
MGRADAMMWANNTRSSPLVSMSEEEDISLGDSELLANILVLGNEQVTPPPIEVILF